MPSSRSAQRARNLAGALLAAKDVRRAPTDLTSAWDFAQTFSRGALDLRPLQIKSEFMGFLELVKGQQPRSIIEIGTANGGSLFLLARTAAPDGRLVSVDMPGGPFGGGYRRTAVRMIRASGIGRQRVHLISGNSHDQVIVAAVREFSAPADLLFIDGDHMFDGVAADFANYSALVRSGGMVAFHDIVPGPEEDVGEVPRFWAEVKDGRHHTEFVQDWTQGGYGIGVLYA